MGSAARCCAGWSRTPERAGLAALVAHAYADNLGLLRVLHRVGEPAPVDADGDLITVTLPLAAGARPAGSVNQAGGADPTTGTNPATGRPAADPADTSADAAEPTPQRPGSGAEPGRRLSLTGAKGRGFLPVGRQEGTLSPVPVTRACTTRREQRASD